MPLIQSGSEEAIRENIARLIREGKSPEEAAAIAYRIARENDRCYGTEACLELDRQDRGGRKARL